MTALQLGLFVVGLSLGNFLYQAFAGRDFERAFDISVFQSWALTWAYLYIRFIAPL